MWLYPSIPPYIFIIFVLCTISLHCTLGPCVPSFATTPSVPRSLASQCKLIFGFTKSSGIEGGSWKAMHPVDPLIIHIIPKMCHTIHMKYNTSLKVDVYFTFTAMAVGPPSEMITVWSPETPASSPTPVVDGSCIALPDTCRDSKGG
jgi:hypothetical protein